MKHVLDWRRDLLERGFQPILDETINPDSQSLATYWEKDNVIVKLNVIAWSFVSSISCYVTTRNNETILVKDFLDVNEALNWIALVSK